MTKFTHLAGFPVWYHVRDEPNPGDEIIHEKIREYACTEKLAHSLEECLTELFEIWGMPPVKAILSMGTIGDGEHAHGQGNAFDLSGFVLADGTVIRVFDYAKREHLMDGINAHLFTYFPQVLNHFYPNHRDHFHVDFNFASQDHYRPGSEAQTFFLQATLRHAFDQDLGTGGRYNDGIDGNYGSKTKKALDQVLFDLNLSGGGGLTNSGTWSKYLSACRHASLTKAVGGAPLGGHPVAPAPPAPLADARVYGPVNAKVYNRGKPKPGFLDELIAWARTADEEIFARNENYDVYSRVSAELGPWSDLLERKAVMCEVLRVLAAFESSWDWNEGPDGSANNTEHDTIEGGIFQCSANSLNYFRVAKDPYLQTALSTVGVSAPGPKRSRAFLKESKSNHPFAMEYCARLLRHTIEHHGPIKHYYGRVYQGQFHDGIGNHVKREAVEEFLKYLA